MMENPDEKHAVRYMAAAAVVSAGCAVSKGW